MECPEHAKGRKVENGSDAVVPVIWARRFFLEWRWQSK